MNILDVDRAGIDSGVFAFTTEFYTEHFLVHARLSSPERRLSDHLNGSVASVDIRPISALQLGTGVAAELGRTHAQITKARILFVVPIAEPDRPTRTKQRRVEGNVEIRRLGWSGPIQYQRDDSHRCRSRSTNRATASRQTISPVYRRHDHVPGRGDQASPDHHRQPTIPRLARPGGGSIGNETTEHLTDIGLRLYFLTRQQEFSTACLSRVGSGRSILLVL